MDSKGTPDLRKLGTRLQEARRKALGTPEFKEDYGEAKPEERSPGIKTDCEAKLEELQYPGPLEKERVPKFIVVPDDESKHPKEIILEEKIVEIHETVELKTVKRCIERTPKVQKKYHVESSPPASKTRKEPAFKRIRTPMETAELPKFPPPKPPNADFENNSVLEEGGSIPTYYIASTSCTMSGGARHRAPKTSSEFRQETKKGGLCSLEPSQKSVDGTKTSLPPGKVPDAMTTQIASQSESYARSQDEREDVQKKTFVKWINSQLAKGNHPPITDLFYDLRDGTGLLALLEVLTDRKYKLEKGKMRVHHMNNVARALRVLEEQNVKLVNISNEHIVDGSPKITLGLVWAVILHWQAQGILKDVMSELQQTNLEKALLAWCRQTTQDYQGVDIRNFTTSWRDGLGFCALLHRHRPDLFEWPVMAKKHPYARLDSAFRIIHEHLGIERLLDPEDVNTQNPDKKSLMMYVMCLFKALPHSQISMDSLDVTVQSDQPFSLESPDKERSMSVVSIGLGTYQQTLEEVLTWLLGAEDRLAGMPPIADNTKDVKDQFHELEDLMMELTARQGNIGEVLGDGSRLLREDRMGQEASEEVRLQMKLLNTRWEELRVKAMDRQTRLHEQLMKLQQEELDTLKHWLTKTEDRIANMSELGPTFGDLEKQIAAHQSLQDDLEAEQDNINSLSNMVVVVDESSSDTVYSSLEDDLNALGERWAHICKWAEQRWSTLQILQGLWGAFDKELQRFQNWLNEKEKLLREMESRPTDDRQELISQAISLQALKSEMELEAVRQSMLEESSSTILKHLPDDSPANDDISAALESMQDRWDCLNSILEAQTQRLVSNGIDVRKVTPSSSESEGIVTRTTTTRTITTEPTEGVTPKRQKMCGKSQAEFVAAVLAFGSWIEGIEFQLQPSACFSIPISQMEQLHQRLKQEIESQNDVYKRVMSLGHSASSQTATTGESAVENEKKLISVKTRWTNLEKMLNALKLRIEFNTQMDAINPEMEKTRDEYRQLEEWVNQTQSTTDFDAEIVKKQIKDCQDKKQRITEVEEDLCRMESSIQALPSLWPQEKDENLRNVQALNFDFKNLDMRITNWEFILSDKAKSFAQIETDSQNDAQLESMDVSESTGEGNPSTEGSFEGLDELSDWLSKVEQQLEACPSMAPLPKMEEGLVKFKLMLEEVDNEKLKLSFVNKNLEVSQSPLVDKVKELNTRWNKIVEDLANKAAEIEKGVEMQRHFEEELSGLRSWLGEVEAFLEAEDAAIGDVETLQAQLEQSSALQEDIVTLESNVANIRVTASHFQLTGDAELRDAVAEQLRDLNTRWENAVTKATNQNATLKEALEKSQKVWNDGDEIKAWLDATESKIPSMNAIETTSEINAVCAQLKELQEEMLKKELILNDLNSLGQDMIGSEKGQPFVELGEMLEELNENWECIKSQVNSRCDVAFKSKENYETFKKLCVEEGQWLDKLEEKLDLSIVKSTDAEEISETLYDLDNYLRSHPDTLQEAQKLGDLLTKEGIMTVAVQNSLHNLTSRYDNLTAKANDQQSRLEGGVEDAQELERDYVKVLEDLSSSQKLLYQFPEGVQLSTIEAQLTSHREVLHKMEQRVEAYRNQGKTQAAQRLQDQLSHLVTQYEEVEEKVKLTQQSKDFDAQLMKLSQQLSEIDEKSREFDIESADSDHLEMQLSRCMELYRSLSLVKSEVEGVIATGRKIVKEDMTPDPETLTLQLDQLKAMYNQLGGSVTDQRGRLEAGLKQSKKAEKESTQLEEWLSATEKELDLREASHPIINLQQELDFAQHAYEDVGRKKPVLASLKEALNALAALFGYDVTNALRDRVQDHSLTWDRVHTRLANRVANLKEENEEKEREMEKFILKVGEIQAWLEKSEKDLGQIENFSIMEKERILKNISTEVQEYRKKLDETREASEDMVARGTLFESRLEPELSRIKRRLDRISGNVTRRESSKDEKPDSEDENIDAYLKEVSYMVDRISVLQDRADNRPKYTEARVSIEEFEISLCQLEPDVATLISKGDTLILKTHISDVPKANAICVSVNNLRKSWMDVKERGEFLKRELSSLETGTKGAPLRAQTLLKWLDEISKKLDLANNDEKQLKKLELEISEMKCDIESLNVVGELLKRYRFEELQPMLTLINVRWSEIQVHLSQYQKVGINQKSIEGSGTPEPTDERALVPDFLANVNRLRESISCVSRQMNSKVLAGKCYENLVAKEDELKAVKKELERLKPKVDNIEDDRLSTMKKASQTQAEHVRRCIDKLREEWAQVNRGYTDRHERWLHCSETWRSLQKTMEDFSLWLNTFEGKVKQTSQQDLAEAKATQKELEKQVTLKHRPSQTLQSLSKEVSEELPPEDARRTQDRVDELLKRWRTLLLDLAARRERIAKEEEVKEGQFESIVRWTENGQAMIDAPVNVTDEPTVTAHVHMVKNHLSDTDSMSKALQQLKEAKNIDVSSGEIRSLETNFIKVSRCLPEYTDKMETKQKVIHMLNVDTEDLYKWAEDLRVKLALRDMTPEEARRARDLLDEKGAIYEALDNTYWALSQDAEGKGLQVCEELKSRMNSIETRLRNLETQFSTSELMSSLTQKQQSQSASPVLATSSISTGVTMATTAAPISLHTGTTVTTSVTNVIQNVVKFEESVTKEGESLVVAPPFPKGPDPSAPTLILAALDKSILQIRDWLTLMQEMSAQQVAVVGDAEAIRKLIEKQKSVLRELESKKPQLDELVASADGLKDDDSRTQLHQQVTKLREHWDETNSSVLGRKTQLDAMLSDTHKFDSKRVELETWLSRMEARYERMSPVARTPDHLDQQIREQKAFHAEVHQYKHHVELFTQMTGRLVTIYQNDDTRRLKKASDSINQRFSSLNSNIISRGKALYAAMNSTHNLSKALEKFFSWLSEAESSASAIELEADKAQHSGTGRRDSANPRATFAHLKDLQSEIESHKDVLASLNDTGQKLLGTLENQDEAMLLHRRLGEMNHRWNTLKYKSIAIRNRLEGTAESWSSLLLSLRELIEWVIRKDTELTGMGPLVGDVNLLAKYENDLAIFRRGLDEKQPVIESNLKSGRQLIASEPPLSDTSDSEAGRDVSGDARYRGEESTRDLTRSVRREVAKLSEKWAALWERAANLAAQVSMAHKKLGVLQKTVEDVGSRLEDSENVVAGWGPMPQDQNLADQCVHNIRKFRETLPDLQRGIDDVNDQAARFSAHNVPLTPANSAALHDLNNRWKNLETAVNDRWRQVAGRSREVTPLTPAQLASSVCPPWERATATNKVPYYINHAQETTHWDHPQMMDLLDSLSEFNHIKFSAYRTATKLRSLQKKLSLDKAKLQLVTDVFDEHGLRGQNDRLIDVNDMVVVLSTLYGRIASDHTDVNTTLATDLCLNWLLNVYDSQRTGQMRVLSFRVGLISLCRGHLEEKYRYMFRLIADTNRMVDQRKLGLLLHDCVQVPRQLGEVAAFGGSNIEPSVRSCFTKAGKDRETIEAVHFLTWVQQEPQSLVWLAVLHRVAASESVQHQVKCNICKTYPIVGLRYRCLKCLSFDMCQRCFFEGRSSKSHKITHPMHEYCTATTAGDEMKDFTKALKNKFKSKRSLQKHTKKGYLPVQTVLEGDPLESPSPSPSHNVSSQDMHSRLELYASRLAEVELRTNSNSTPDSEDEHGLIAQYCQSLSSSDAPFPVPKSPLQIMASVDADQKDELEQMIRDLEEENRALQAEYERLKSEQPSGSVLDEGFGQRSEAEMLAEAKLLREHKGRLEARMSILEDHNRQLEAQLQRLRQLLVEQQSGMGSPNKSGTLQTKSVTASQLAMDSPAKINGHSSQGDLEKAVGSLVASMNPERKNGSHSERDDDEHSDENDYDNTVAVTELK